MNDISTGIVDNTRIYIRDLKLNNRIGYFNSDEIHRKYLYYWLFQIY